MSYAAVNAIDTKPHNTISLFLEHLPAEIIRVAIILQRFFLLEYTPHSCAIGIHIVPPRQLSYTISKDDVVP